MHARQIARGGMVTGLSVVLLYVSTFLSFASWAACMLVGFIPALFFLVNERKMGTMIYIATSVLSIFILPDKTIAMMYAGLFGLYTVLRFWVEHIPSRLVRWLIKLVFANVWILIVLWAIYAGFFPEFANLSHKLTFIVVICGNLILIYYDFCLSRIFAGLRNLAQRFYNSLK